MTSHPAANGGPVNDLLNLAINGHGGMRRWEQLSRFTAAAGSVAKTPKGYSTASARPPGTGPGAYASARMSVELTLAPRNPAGLASALRSAYTQGSSGRPLWAAMIADRDRYQGHRSGNINPWVYSLPRTDPKRYFNVVTGIGPRQRRYRRRDVPDHAGL